MKNEKEDLQAKGWQKDNSGGWRKSPAKTLPMLSQATLQKVNMPCADASDVFWAALEGCERFKEMLLDPLEW